ncbi:amino acid adenylation domain-containing protein [Streptomyces sp. A0958]|uniref:amino acid adenylation domain-containing protein n=1 Tax=Streptomyces sp. A0958 TaxID=2563101 RepID=UPI00109E5D69|nr:amino acid adenylation domain-containing protein [Streptomyces sp. A0958]THA59954.1 amino acid adenylation domain-containing protein [Streptomyces sp. A0958]
MTPNSPAPEPGLLGRFLQGLGLSPDGTALKAGGREHTYRALDLAARTLAGTLLARSPGADRVGVLAHRGERAYAGFLAGLYAGAAVVPLNPDYPAERTRAMIEAARVTVLVVDDAGEACLPALGDALDGVTVVGRETGEPLTRPVPVRPEDPAYIMFTSGSTGVPKGVPVSHGNVLHYLRCVQDHFGFGTDDVFSQTFNLTFDLAVFDMFAAWGCGASLVVVPPGAYTRLPAFLTRHRITVWFSVPAVVPLLRRSGALTAGAMPTLRHSLFCGEALLREDAASWQAAADGSAVHNLYGPTELTISCTLHRWDPALSPALCVNDVVPIGRPHPGLRVHLHRDGGEAAGTGELCVSGPQMVTGYLDPADDRGRYLSHGGERWYRTGDLVRTLPDGQLAYIGRLDHQVNVGGVRMELREIDQALRRCAGVDEAVTLVAGGVLRAYVTGAAANPAALREELGSILPRELIPRRIERLAAFPLNANGKVDRPALTRAATGEQPVAG